MTSRQAKRTHIQLTSEQQAQISEVRRKIESEEKADILAIAKQLRERKRQEATVLGETLKVLKAERVAQGLSLSELEERTGIAKSNLSKLENAEQANPTIATLMTYADALGKKLVVALADK